MSKSESVKTPAFVAPLVGSLVDLTPIEPGQVDAKIESAFTNALLYELACGLGEAPAPDYLRHVLFDSHDVTLWALAPAGAEAPIALAAHSRYTTLDRVAVYFWDSVYGDLEVWNEAIALLVEHVFAHAPEAEHVYVHMPLPVPEDFHNALMLQGFAPWGTGALLRAPERAAYGLDRAVFDLYRQDVDDEGDGGDGSGDGDDGDDGGNGEDDDGPTLY